MFLEEIAVTKLRSVHQSRQWFGWFAFAICDRESVITSYSWRPPWQRAQRTAANVKHCNASGSRLGTLYYLKIGATANMRRTQHSFISVDHYKSLLFPLIVSCPFVPVLPLTFLYYRMDILARSIPFDFSPTYILIGCVGVKLLSIYGFVYLFQGRRSLAESGYMFSVEEQSRTIAVWRAHLLDDNGDLQANEASEDKDQDEERSKFHDAV